MVQGQTEEPAPPIVESPQLDFPTAVAPPHEDKSAVSESRQSNHLQDVQHESSPPAPSGVKSPELDPKTTVVLPEADETTAATVTGQESVQDRHSKDCLLNILAEEMMKFAEVKPERNDTSSSESAQSTPPSEPVQPVKMIPKTKPKITKNQWDRIESEVTKETKDFRPTDDKKLTLGMLVQFWIWRDLDTNGVSKEELS